MSDVSAKYSEKAHTSVFLAFKVMISPYSMLRTLSQQILTTPYRVHIIIPIFQNERNMFELNAEIPALDGYSQDSNRVLWYFKDKTRMVLSPVQHRDGTIMHTLGGFREVRPLQQLAQCLFSVSRS